MPLELAYKSGQQISAVDDPYSWVEISRFEISASGDFTAVDALRRLFDHPLYAGAYYTADFRIGQQRSPNGSERSVSRSTERTHGPYLLRHISSSAFVETDCANALRDFLEWLDDSRFSLELTLKDDFGPWQEVVSTLRRFDRAFVMQGLNESATHDFAMAVDPFFEFVLVDQPRCLLTVIAGGGD